MRCAHLAVWLVVCLAPAARAAGPVITRFSPASGNAGDTVTLSGKGFTGARSVTFNAVPAKFRVVSDTTITATVPEMARTGKIKVGTSSGAVESGQSFSILPRLTSLSPEKGAPGDRVKIAGTGLAGATAVRFHGCDADFELRGATEIVASVPDRASTGPISVTTPSGMGVSTASFIVRPGISGFSPTAAPVGSVVAIRGTALNRVTAVAFNGTAARYVERSESELRAWVPAGATSGQITVTNDAGTSLRVVVPDGARSGRITVGNGAARGKSGKDFTVQ